MHCAANSLAGGLVCPLLRKEGEVKVHNGLDISGDNVEKLVKHRTLIFRTFGMTSEGVSKYCEEDDDLALAYYDDDDDFDTFTDGDVDCSCEDGGNG